MEHIVQFGISVDDDKIAKSIEQNVERAVINHIVEKVNGQITRKYYYGDENEPLKNMIKEQVNKIIMDKQDYILENAAKILADKLARSKAGKQLLEDLRKEYDNE